MYVSISLSTFLKYLSLLLSLSSISSVPHKTLILWSMSFRQLWCSCLSCRSPGGEGYRAPRGEWPLFAPPPVKLPRPLLQLLLEAVEADLRPGLAGGQSAFIISSSGSNPGLSRLQACLDGGDGVPITPPSPRSWCWMFSISIPSFESGLCEDLAVLCGTCCGLTRDELIVQTTRLHKITLITALKLVRLF